MGHSSPVTCILTRLMKRIYLAILCLCAAHTSWAQRTAAPSSARPADPDIRLALHDKAWRSIGPFRGGRSIAVAGHASQPLTYYFGATGGGVWKTEDGGVAWRCVSDSFFRRSSVGALAVAASDPNVIYAGMGERDIRGNFAQGDGVYRSIDAGKTWKHLGLEKTGIIGRIVVHPTDPNQAWVAALGRIFGPDAQSAERGVYRTKDGGNSWQLVLHTSPKAGAVHISIDPLNPRVLYAAMWQAYRTGWSMSSGGPESSLWQSTDGGDTWKNISARVGLPKGIMGKIGISASGAQAGLVWTLIESANGGLFRSDNYGETWARVSENRNLRQRAWYYSHVHADPQDANTVYVLNVNFQKSVDGGKTFSVIPVGHGDTHDLWIDPTNSKRMIIGDDGGAEVTVNGGATWTDIDLPTAQFYHVTLDNEKPYNIYGAQQDNSTVGIRSRTAGGSIGIRDWWEVAGGESGYIAVDPADANITYGGSYGGYLTRHDRCTENEIAINVYPDNPIGEGANAMKYRFQWTYPIVFSPHDPKRLYCSAQYVFVTTNEGKSWTRISPDLTRNDSTKLQPSGGPITKDNTGVEVYGTVFALAESPKERGLIWAGSDDGVLSVTRDGGANWKTVTPAGLPEWSLISSVEPSTHDAGTCYVAANRYKWGDEKPYLFKTSDYGATWARIDAGIPEGAFTRVLRADPNRKGVLYAGTETGVWVSLSDGAAWQPLQLNLPVTPIHDLAIQPREKDLVVATHGRSFWVLDDVSALHTLAAEPLRAGLHVYTPRPSLRMAGGAREVTEEGRNAPSGAGIQYVLDAKAFEKGAKPVDTLFVEIRNARDSVIARFNSRADVKGKAVKESAEFYEKSDIQRNGVPTAKPGLNRFVWNLRTADATELPGGIYWGGSLTGPTVVPGRYTAVVRTVGSLKSEQRVPLDILPDPRLQVSQADYQAKYDLHSRINAKVSAVHEAILRIREVKKQVAAAAERIKDPAALKPIEALTKPLISELDRIEGTLVQGKVQASQDILNFPIKLNNKLVALAGTVSTGEGAPTTQSYEALADMSAQADAQLAKLKALLDTELPKLNAAIGALALPAVSVK